MIKMSTYVHFIMCFIHFQYVFWERSSSNCEVFYQGSLRKFSKCKWINKKLQVFRTVKYQKNIIRRLIKVKRFGYVGFFWGYSRVLNSQMRDVLLESSGESIQRRYIFHSFSERFLLWATEQDFVLMISK